jgi:hypothetical protein
MILILFYPHKSPGLQPQNPHCRYSHNYGNERTSLDDFITKVKEAESDVNVEIKDDNASLKTYKKLIEQLEKSKIPFTEE